VLVRPGDTAALADALVQLLRDPARRRAMGEAALERNRVQFSPERQVARWTALVRDVAAHVSASGREVAA
jgi:glycosyltransferase involved in cell wall biosynthesis